jgi:hypothetical protein
MPTLPSAINSPLTQGIGIIPPAVDVANNSLAF